jgi:hypothetical protein
MLVGSSNDTAADVVFDKVDELTAAVDAVAEKSAESVARAYETLIDAIFGSLD